MSNKTKKLTCNITGKVLFAAGTYYTKKVKKAGSEDDLHRTYVCREAKKLLQKGYTIDQAQQSLDAESYTCTLTDDDIQDIVGSTSLRINNVEEAQISIIKTDPDVAQFIKNITSNE
tara:strand:+ start:368 stop:718 length:351 start_codon:yes stop_codon:yes gene_type:complete